MSYQNLDLNLLRAFDVIYTERNLTRASKILYISQPAVSNALQRLRDSLGDPLFIRERRGMMPTPFADSFAPAVHSALQLIRSGLGAREEFSPQLSKRMFRVSMNDPAEALFLPSLVKILIDMAPDVSVQSTFVGRHDLANEMAIGAIDVAIEVPFPVDDRLHFRELVGEYYVCVVRPEHPLLSTGMTLDDYLAMEHVHVSARRHGQGHVDRALTEQSLSRNIKVRTRNPGLAAEIVHNSNIAMTVPERFAGYYKLEAIRLPFKVPPVQWQIYWPVRLEHDPGNMWLRDTIAGLAESYKVNGVASSSPTGKPDPRNSLKLSGNLNSAA